MAVLTRLLRRLTALRRRSQIDRDLEEEMRLHVELRAERLEAAGLSPEASRTAARRRFGNARRLREDSVAAWGWRWLEQLVQDLRFGTRTLARQPGFTLAAIVTLGLGIGANTAIFSVLNGVVLKPLPYTDGERLVVISQAAPGRDAANAGLSVREFRDYRDRAQSFDALVEYHQMYFDLLRRGEPDRVNVGVVSHDFFAVLGITPQVGRTFRPEEDRRGADAVLILGYRYWQEKFGGDPRIVGQVFEMNDRPHRVIGVLPNVPHYPQENDVYMPVASCPFRFIADEPDRPRRSFNILSAFGRLKPGVTREQAEREVEALCGRSNREHPDVYAGRDALTATTPTVQSQLVGNATALLLVLLGATGLVLLIACANVANLAVARLLRRDRELGLREALGAGRGRLVRQLLTESTLLSILAGAAGVLLAAPMVSLLVRVAAPFVQRTDDIVIDGRVLLFAAAISAITGVIFGTVPALLATLDLGAIVRAGRAVETRARRRVQGGLVVAQVAVAVVLLTGAGLLLTSFYRLRHVDVGFETQQVVTGEAYYTFTRSGTTTLERFVDFYERVMASIERQPGVSAAAATSAVPLASSQPVTAYRVEGKPPAADGPDDSGFAIVTPRYFDILGIPIIDGRAFSDADSRTSAKVVIINQTMARELPGRAVGAGLRLGSETAPRTIVGVAADVRQHALEGENIPHIYIPLRQTPFSIDMRILARASGDPAAAMAALRRGVHAVDADLPVENLSTLEGLRGRHLLGPQLTTMLLTVFAGLALAVALTGIAGVMAMHVSHRIKEFGIRMALGASHAQVLGPVLRNGLSLVAAGLVIGLAASLLITQVLSPYLFDTTPTDPAAFAGVAAALLAAGALACLAPAWRAIRVDPHIVFRTD